MIVEFCGGKIAYFYCLRMMAAGQEELTEIFDTERKLTDNMHPQSNLVNTYELFDICRELSPTYYDLFEQIFVTEANKFIAACFDDGKVPVELAGAVQAVNIGCALQERLVSWEEEMVG